MGAAVCRFHDAGAAAGGNHILAVHLALKFRAAIQRADFGEFARPFIPAGAVIFPDAGGAKNHHG